MLVVAGLNLSNRKPRVWEEGAPCYLPNLRAVMVSYADFHRMPVCRQRAMEQGLHAYLNIPQGVQVYLDNGAFYFHSRGGEAPSDHYQEFVERAKPDWWPIPQDFIPTPRMTAEEQLGCYTRTMEVNLAYQHDGYTPVIHISRFLEEYTVAITANNRLARKPGIALGGIVPNLLRAPKAMSYADILTGLRHVREVFAGKHIHVFGIGGTATIHLAALLGMDSVDSSGWRNRAARGMVQLPGSGERIVSNLGNWRGRTPSEEEWEKLRECACPAFQQSGLDGLKAKGVNGFCNRAVHNLWVLLEEANLVSHHLQAGTYKQWYRRHLDNTTYLPLIDELVRSHDIR